MKFFNKYNPMPVSDARKQVAGLIFKLLTQNPPVVEILKYFPKDVDDLSIQCAWHAIVHFDADAELRLDPNYAEEQNEYLEMIAFILKEGNPLPQNIIDSYNKLYEIAPMPHSNTMKGILKSLLRFTI